MEWIILALFCAALLLCIALDISILYAMGFGLVLFLLACAVYAALGFAAHTEGNHPDLFALFQRVFRLHPLALVPALVIFALSAFRVNVKIAMTASILASIPVCLFLQELPPAQLLRAALCGFVPADEAVAAMVSGGGIVSMLRVACIVFLSSAYSGLFEKTGLLDGAKRAVRTVSARTTPFAAMVLTSFVTGMISCNQTLTIILTSQLTKDETPDAGELALRLEDSAVVIAPMIPWSIAGGVPLASIGAPTASILLACYLYFLPLWGIVCSLVRKKREASYYQSLWRK